MSETPEIPAARTVRDTAGGRRPVRHLDPERVRRSPGASRVEPTAYVADRLIVRGAPPEDLRDLVSGEASMLRAGGPGAEVALPAWSSESDVRTWTDGVRQIAADMGYRGDMKKRLARADAAGARYALILGDDELARGEAQLKALQTGEQQAVSLDRVVEAIR